MFDEWADFADTTAEDAWGGHSHLRLLTQQIGRRKRLESTTCLPVLKLVFSLLHSPVLSLSLVHVCVSVRVGLSVV